jgi:hypothetical protein
MTQETLDGEVVLRALERRTCREKHKRQLSSTLSASTSNQPMSLWKSK